MKHAIQIEKEAAQWMRTSLKVRQAGAKTTAGKAIFEQLWLVPHLTEAAMDAAINTLVPLVKGDAGQADLDDLRDCVKQFKRILADQARERERINA